MIWNSQNLEYRESGSVTFTEAQRKSYALIVDVELLSYLRKATRL